MADSLCYAVDINAALENNYTAIKNFFEKKECGDIWTLQSLESHQEKPKKTVVIKRLCSQNVRYLEEGGSCVCFFHA